jgi:hypothetical protein
MEPPKHYLLPRETMQSVSSAAGGDAVQQCANAARYMMVNSPTQTHIGQPVRTCSWWVMFMVTSLWLREERVH